jgi:hypothetical protein
MKSMIHHIGIGKRRPLMFHGPSGIGKSEGIQQSCAEHGGVMCDIRVSQYESIDFRGIPNITDGETVWNMPATLPFKGNARFAMADPDKPIYLFLDEVNQGDPSVMSVCYQLINDRRVGEHELMDNVVIICAGNRAQDRGTTNKFPAPLSNRMTHAELTADIKSWTAWAARAGVHPTVIGFLNFRSELLTTFDTAKPVPAFATPRTWKFVAEDFADETIPEDVRAASISGSVGEGPGVELMGFAEIMKTIIPIEEIIKAPDTTPVPEELSLQWAMATHVAGSIDLTNASPLSTYLKRMEPEMTVMAWMLAVGRNEELCESDAFLFDFAPQYRGLFTS